MGKSTLINRFVPQAGAQVGEISLALNAGKHTTTTTTWYWLGDDPQAGALIDSPGFQEFGLRHIEAPDLASLMPDLRAHLGSAASTTAPTFTSRAAACARQRTLGESRPAVTASTASCSRNCRRAATSR
jgi:ribosome small subunit-dependent GTPase A